MRKSELLAALFCLVASLGSAAEIEIAPPITQLFVAPYTWDTLEGLVPQGQEFDFSGLFHIKITGEIKLGDAQRLQDLFSSEFNEGGGIRDITQKLIVSFDSQGGYYQEGLALSDLIQNWSAATYVGPGDQCLSACALAWLGGRSEIIRNIEWQPTRFLHVDSKVGFHAPFNNEYPQGLRSLDQQGVQLVADLFYELATESIRELQKRLTGWQIRPEFAFEFLGRGSDEFLIVDHADPLFRNQFTVLAEKSRPLQQIGSLEAVAVCSYILRTSVEPAANYQDVRNMRGAGPDFSDPQQLIGFASGTAPEVIIDTTMDGQDFIVVEDMIPGRGPFNCRIESTQDGWVVRLSGDLPKIPDAMGNVLIFNDDLPFYVSEHNAVGAMTPWRVLKGDDLWLRSDPFSDLSSEYLRESGPSFECSGDLDPAAKMICAFPVLSRADAIMVTLYGAKREAPGVKESQRTWIQERNRACRVARISADQEISFRIAGYCLLAFNLARIKALADS